MDEANSMTRRPSVSKVAWAIAARSLKLIPRIPSTFLPSIVMPVFLIVAFSGAFSRITAIPGFPTPKAIDWFVPLGALMGSAFAGITTGMGVARDVENGFYDRLLASPAPRFALLVGPMLAALLRAVFPLTLVMVAGTIGGMNVPTPLGIVTTALAALGVSLLAAAWSIGIALRLKTQQAAPLMQVAIFLGLFLSTAQMPLDLLSGWLHTVARFNPTTPILALAREGFVGSVTWADTWPGISSIVGLGILVFAFAARGMKRLA